MTDSADKPTHNDKMDVPINDLYSGLNIPPQTKRQREDEAKKKNDNHDKEDDRTTATDLSATVKRPRLAKKPRGIFDTMKKLEKHLVRHVGLVIVSNYNDHYYSV